MKRKIGFVLPIKTSSVSLPESFAHNLPGDCDLSALKHSIAESGILFPLYVREISKGRFEAVCGKKRLLCAKSLGLKFVPCVIINADDTNAKIMALCETLSARPPDFFELADALSDIIINGDLSADFARIKLGISRKFLSDKLNLLKLTDEIKARITSAGLSEQQAAQLLKIPPEKRNFALDYIIARQLNEKETEEFILYLLSPKKEEPKKPVRKAAIGDLKLFSNSLSKMLSTLTFSGYKTKCTVKENDDYINYNIRLYKKPDEAEYCQLPLC